MKKLLALNLLVLLLSTQLFAQNRILSGTVTDATTGEALIGVNITGKGTTSGTVTDIDGKYTLELPKEVTVLEFSYVGYTTVEKPITALVINVSMSVDQAVIDEVVITALGIKKEEKALTYNSQKIDGEDINKAREANLVNSLSGKIAGAQITNSSGAVGASTRIILRGASSLTGNNQPLFIVDGIPMDNSSFSGANSGSPNGSFDMPNGIASINPDNIETITVLPSAKASALYGVRAANGVIIITTKKGKEMKGKLPLGIELNSSITFQKPFRLPDFQNSYGQGASSTFFDYEIDNAIDESWGPALDKGLQFVQWNSYMVGGEPLPWVSRPNNVKQVFQTGTTWDNSIALTGANDKGSFRAAFGNMNQKGTIPNTDFNRYTVGLTASYKLTQKLIPSFTINYSKEKSNNLPYVGYASDNIMTQLIYTGRNVDFNALKDWRNLPLAPVGTPAEGTPINWNTEYNNNPFWVLDNNLNKYNRDRIIGNMQVLYNINDNFSVRLLSGIDFYSMYTTEQKAIGTVEKKDGFYEELHRRFYELNNELLVSYSQKWVNNKLGISLNVSGNLMQQRYKFIGGTLNALELPDLYNLGNVKTGNKPIASSAIEENNLNTIRGFGELSWASWIYADFSLINDWSSRLPTENNSFFSYSTGISFIPSEFLKNQRVLSYLKVRASYANVGNFGALVPYRIVQTYDIREDIPFSSILINDPATLNNPNLKPERTREWEFGVDVKLFNNRIGFSATYYAKKSRDLLLPIQTSAASGYTTAWQNTGSMRNRGVEIQLNATPLDKKDYKINVFINWAKNNNQVLSVGEEQEGLILGGHWDMTLEARAGQPYGLIVGKGFKRDNNGNIIYANGVPVIDEERKILGNIQPKWTGGLGVEFYIKGLRIYTLFDAKIGGNIHSTTYTWGRYAGSLAETLLGRETGIVGNGVKNIGTDSEPIYVPNDIAVTAKFYNQQIYTNTNTESSVFDASYIKWRELVVSYDLPSKLFAKIKIQGVSFGLVARNLALVHSRVPHIDPETAFSSSNGNQGQEFGQLPSNRSIGFNFNIKF